MALTPLIDTSTDVRLALPLITLNSVVNNASVWISKFKAVVGLVIVGGLPTVVIFKLLVTLFPFSSATINE
ncbi:MAG: hypothetical protein IPN86_03480 [Saprospiraceae bacterium]|nr:hypothetical protein [Saprospiraceae bacterium]